MGVLFLLEGKIMTVWHVLTVEHPVISAVGAIYAYSNIVGALPEPKGDGLYKAFYAVNHGLAGNILYAGRKLFPQFFPAPGEK